MKRINKEGQLEEAQPFDSPPEDFGHLIRDRWLPRIHLDEQVEAALRIPPFHTRGSSLIPYLEREAIEALADLLPELPLRPVMDRGRPASMKKDTQEAAFERWRDLWAREAHQNAGRVTGSSTRHAAAFNILATASALRNAVDAGQAEKAAALGMLLAFEALGGGYGLNMQAEVEAAPKKARAPAYKKGLEPAANDYKKAKAACVALAAEIWGKDRSKRIGKVRKACQTLMIQDFHLYPALQKPPSLDLIGKWLNEEEEKGLIVIPEGARKAGRSKN